MSPPMYRTKPIWYLDHLPEISVEFSRVFSNDRPANMSILTSFYNQNLLDDGFNLTPVSGLYLLLHLFDDSEAMLALKRQPPEQQNSVLSETARSNRDRITMLEHDHYRLGQLVDHKVAADSEFNDWVINRADESWLTLSGLPRLASSLTRQDWQKAVKPQVRACLLDIVKFFKLNIRFDVVVVVNPIKGRTSGPNILNVLLNSTDASKAVRDAFSLFYRNPGQYQRPSRLIGISVQNKVTHETRIRVQIMKELGKNYVGKNSGASVTVRGFESRPTLVLVPPSGSKDARIRNMTFIDAVRQLPVEFSDENLVQIFRVIGGGFQGRLRSLFIILSDDNRDEMADLVRSKQRTGRVVSFAGATSGSGSGMDVNSSLRRSLLQPPPPPPPVAESPGANLGSAVERDDDRDGDPKKSKSKHKQRHSEKSRESKKRKHRGARKSSKKRHHRGRSRSSSSSSSSSGSTSGSDSDSSGTD